MPASPLTLENVYDMGYQMPNWR